MKFKTNKDKGNFFEKLSAQFWTKKMGVEIRQSYGSGSITGIPGDLMARNECLLKDFVIDVKAVKGLLTKELLGLYNKNKEDAGLKPSFLEIYDDEGTNAYVFISRNDLARVFYELNGYRRDNQGI